MQRAEAIAIVIEDDPASSEALQFILRDWGCDVIAGVSATEVAAQLGARAPRVRWIITDFHLGPGPDGVTGLPPLRAAVPQARVLVLSGSMRGRSAQAAIAAGYDSMDKPAKPDAIIAWLEAHAFP